MSLYPVFSKRGVLDLDKLLFYVPAHAFRRAWLEPDEQRRVIFV